MNTLDVNDSVKVLVFVEAIIVRYSVLQNQRNRAIRFGFLVAGANEDFALLVVESAVG